MNTFSGSTRNSVSCDVEALFDVEMSEVHGRGEIWAYEERGQIPEGSVLIAIRAYFWSSTCV